MSSSAAKTHERLTITELTRVHNELISIASKWKFFGGNIGVLPPELSNIEKSNTDFDEKLYKVLEYRLKQLPLLTWHDIVRALRSPAVHEHVLASQIGSIYSQLHTPLSGTMLAAPPYSLQLPPSSVQPMLQPLSVPQYSVSTQSTQRSQPVDSPLQPMLQPQNVEQYSVSTQSTQRSQPLDSHSMRWSQALPSQNIPLQPSAALVGQSSQPPYPQNVNQQPLLYYSAPQRAPQHALASQIGSNYSQLHTPLSGTMLAAPRSIPQYSLQLPPSSVQPMLQLQNVPEYSVSTQSTQWSQDLPSQNIPLQPSATLVSQPPYPASLNVYSLLYYYALQHSLLMQHITERYQRPQIPLNPTILPTIPPNPGIYNQTFTHQSPFPQNQYQSSSQHTQHPSLSSNDEVLLFDQTRFSNSPRAQCSYTQSMPPCVTTLSSGDYITPSNYSPGQHPVSSASAASQLRSTQSLPPPSDLCPATETISAQSPTYWQSYSPRQQPQSSPPAEMISVCTASVNTFIYYVKQKYSVKVVEKDKKWSLSPTVEFINLTCIDRRCVKSREYGDITLAMVQDGNVDTIQEKKGPIQFSEIAQGISLPSNTSVSESNLKRVLDDRRLILVEGAPGVGKSTFAWEFCRKWWLKENVAQQYDLVLLLRLRDKGTRNARDLQQLISHPLPDVSEAVCYELVTSHTFHALIILEGYDELPESQRNDSCSIFNQLISGELLPLATVLVTSRPWATKDIHKHHEHRIYQHIEVLGFTKHQIAEYINRTVPDQVKDLNSYLERHPQIKSGMYIPLNSAIVVAVYIASKSDQQPMPNTITELYTCVVHISVRRHLKGHPELHGGSVKGLPAMNNITVPCEVHRNFVSLCKLAYDGIVSEKDEEDEEDEVRLIFRESELPPNFDNLGFMDSVTELYVTGESSSSHNFLHLTFQEFFAAVHISTLPPEEQLKYFMKDSGKNEGRLKVTLKFLAGLKKLDCITKETVSSIIKPVVPPEGGSKYQIHPDIEVDIDIVNWMFESQSVDTISLMLSENKVRFEADKNEMLPMDFYSLGYCIFHSKCQWLLSLTGKRVLSKEKIQMLAKGTTGSVNGGKVIGLEYVSHYQSSNFELFCVELKGVLHLNQLSLKLGIQADVVSCPEFPTLSVLEIDFYSQMGGINLPPSLNSLNIYCIGLEPNESQSIAKFLSSSPHLKELNLNIYFDEREMEPIFKALATNESLQLERLELYYNKCRMNWNTYEYMITFIKKQKILQYFAISSSTITVHKLRQFLQTSNRERTALQMKFRYRT